LLRDNSPKRREEKSQRVDEDEKPPKLFNMIENTKKGEGVSQKLRRGEKKTKKEKKEKGKPTGTWQKSQGAKTTCAAHLDTGNGQNEETTWLDKLLVDF
jgi:hypothetical protein